MLESNIDGKGKNKQNWYLPKKNTQKFPDVKNFLIHVCTHKTFLLFTKSVTDQSLFAPHCCWCCCLPWVALSSRHNKIFLSVHDILVKRETFFMMFFSSLNFLHSLIFFFKNTYLQIKITQWDWNWRSLLESLRKCWNGFKRKIHMWKFSKRKGRLNGWKFPCKKTKRSIYGKVAILHVCLLENQNLFLTRKCFREDFFIFSTITCSLHMLLSCLHRNKPF